MVTSFRTNVRDRPCVQCTNLAAPNLVDSTSMVRPNKSSVGTYSTVWTTRRFRQFEFKTTWRMAKTRRRLTWWTFDHPTSIFLIYVWWIWIMMIWCHVLLVVTDTVTVKHTNVLCKSCISSKYFVLLVFGWMHDHESGTLAFTMIDRSSCDNVTLLPTAKLEGYDPCS